VNPCQASVEGLVDPPNQLDVLLRHRLLPQAGGFEGLLRRWEGIEVRHLPLPKPVGVDEAVRHPDTARFPDRRLAIDELPHIDAEQAIRDARECRDVRVPFAPAD
jgi:hypothetical protein